MWHKRLFNSLISSFSAVISIFGNFVHNILFLDIIDNRLADAACAMW
jgi:hypothetical protein